MNHPNLSDDINRNIAKSEIDGGVWLQMPTGEVARKEATEGGNVLTEGRALLVQTKNTLYRIEKRGEDDFYISGHARYCPEPTKANIHGSTWGGSMLKMGWVGRGMHLEFSTSAHGTVTTSTISDISEVSQEQEATLGGAA